MLIGFLVDVKVGCLSFGVEEGGVIGFVDILQCDWEGETTSENGVAVGDDFGGDSGFVCLDVATETIVCPREFEYVAWTEETQNI